MNHPLPYHPGNRVTQANLDEIFTYHNDPARAIHYIRVREAAKVLALTILENCPECADRSAALREVRNAVMSANASIALAPEYPYIV
jgi:hypothetical protein